MKKLATLTAAAALMLGFAGAAQAGGASESNGSGEHCYMLFDDFDPDPGFDFAQVMSNEEDMESFEEKVEKARDKYLAAVVDGGLNGDEVETTGDC